MELFYSIRKTTMAYYIAWISVALFFFYQYILRISPGVMVVELREMFKLTAQEFSSLGSIYLFSYSLLQIPLGFILDRVGIRKVVLASVWLCIIGTGVFTYASNVWMLQGGRLLIGLGSAPAFICALKLIHDHLPKPYHGLLMGLTLAMGTLGALLSGKFLVMLLEQHGWKQALQACAAVGGIIFGLIWWVVPAKPRVHDEPMRVSHRFGHAFLIICQKERLIYSIIAISVFTPLCVLADLWGTAFLMQKYALSRATAAQLSLYLYGGLTVGSLILPWLSVKYGRSKEVIQYCIGGLFFSLLILLYKEPASLVQLSILLILIGGLCGAEMICFAGALDDCPAAHSGLALGVVNTLNMLGGAIIQQLIGWYLDYRWSGQYGAEGARFYPTTELTAAFSLLIVMIFFCGLLSLRLSKNK